MAAQQHQQQRQRQSQQSALRMPQTTGTLISIQLKKLPSALNMPQMRISSNDNLRRLATLVLSAPLSSPQSSPTPTATNGQTSPVPSLNGSEESHPPLLLHNENFHKDRPRRGPFLHCIHHAQMSLGPWELHNRVCPRCDLYSLRMDSTPSANDTHS